MAKHEFIHEERISTGDCDDHHCPGHYDLKLQCRCGWTITIPQPQFGLLQDDLDKLLLEHRLDVLEAHV